MYIVAVVDVSKHLNLFCFVLPLVLLLPNFPLSLSLNVVISSCTRWSNKLESLITVSAAPASKHVTEMQVSQRLDNEMGSDLAQASNSQYIWTPHEKCITHRSMLAA